ncbi:MAG: RNA polymerase sigma factor [Oscillospiraceae bacterium]|nr:RNA polymerase sigma factor [Oscillospiraceae bacterium]
MATFQNIYEDYARPVYRFLLQLTANEDKAEELLQETFYRALKNIDRFEGRCSLYTWLCQIGKNAWYKECRRSKRFEQLPLEELSVSAEEDPEAMLLKKEQQMLIREAILKLEEPYQDVFIMHVLGEIKLAEIATLYGKSESWARVTFFRGKQKILKEVLK